MSIESLILLSNADSATADLVYTDRDQGAGYHKKSDPLHTAVYSVNNFTGSIKLQGTLVRYPGESDWVDIRGSEYLGSAATEDNVLNFIGNFIWIRAVYSLVSGEILQIRYNY